MHSCFQKSYQSIVKSVLSLELDCIFQIDYYPASFFEGSVYLLGLEILRNTRWCSHAWKFGSRFQLQWWQSAPFYYRDQLWFIESLFLIVFEFRSFLLGLTWFFCWLLVGSNSGDFWEGEEVDVSFLKCVLRSPGGKLAVASCSAMVQSHYRKF